jgi:cobalt-zinc-cadmium efflux system outer membrane protein
MRRIRVAALAAAALGFHAAPAAAQHHDLTLEGALALARERAPGIVAADAAIGEARGRLTGASVWLRENPVVQGALGTRLTGDGADTRAARASILQPLEVAAQRGARVRGAESAVERVTAEADDTRRRTLRSVAVAFYQALHATAALNLARRADTVAGEIVDVARERYGAGDIARLDVRLAEASRSRATAAVQDAEARREDAIGTLRVLLGLPLRETLSVQGTLGAGAVPTPMTLEAEIDMRPDVRALEAALREAEADAALGRAGRFPTVAVGAEYERDEGDDVVMGQIALGFPVFDRGQGLRAAAEARSRRLRIELAAARANAAAALRTTYEVYRHRQASAEELQRVALPLQDENETLARRAYESGQLGLVDLLAVRREVLGTRQEALDRALESATAGVELQFTAGSLR